MPTSSSWPCTHASLDRCASPAQVTSCTYIPRDVSGTISHAVPGTETALLVSGQSTMDSQHFFRCIRDSKLLDAGATARIVLPTLRYAMSGTDLGRAATRKYSHRRRSCVYKGQNAVPTPSDVSAVPLRAWSARNEERNARRRRFQTRRERSRTLSCTVYAKY
eukprot:3660219-Rhodomonas_salina.2